jgi:tetratricopeptide (TPR) repeat protein
MRARTEGKPPSCRTTGIQVGMAVGVFFGCLGVLGGAAPQEKGTQPQTLSEKGHKALEGHRFGEAQAAYEQVLKLDPNLAEAHSNLGLALFMEGRYEDAIPHFRKALELNPKLPRTEVLLALSYFNTNQLRRAVPLLETAHSANKRDTVVIEHLAEAYLRLKEFGNALALSGQWVELEPNNPDALYLNGQAAFSLGVSSYQKLKEVAPNSYRVHQLQGDFFRQRGQLEPAIAEYKQAIGEKPDVPGLHYQLGRVYWENGRLDEAREEFSRELLLSPFDPATNYLIGDVYLQQGNLTESAKYLAQATRLQPDLIDAQLDLAKVSRQQGSTAEAIKVLQEIARVAPERQEPHYMLYDLYRSAGQGDSAAKELETFQSLKRRAAEKTASGAVSIGPE